MDYRFESALGDNITKPIMKLFLKCKLMTLRERRDQRGQHCHRGGRAGRS